MDELKFSEPYIIKCPICSETRYNYFRFLSNVAEKTTYSSECINGHKAMFLLTACPGIAMASFMYGERQEKFDYSVYLKSQEWKDKSKQAKQKAGWRCQLCNHPGDDTTLHAHHRTYENIGKEKPGDIIVLCQDCHAKFHDKDKD